MNTLVRASALATILLPAIAVAQALPGSGTEEYGLTPRELIQAIEKTEESISKCMRDQGFQYFAVDHATVRMGMKTEILIPGLTETQFIRRYGFGISTFYTGAAPQLATVQSPAAIALGVRNIQYFKALSPTDQVAYNRAMLGESGSPTFAMALEHEILWQTGGCTRKAVEQVFKPDQLNTTYIHPHDALLSKDARMKAAVVAYAAEMKKAGYDFNHPDEVEPLIRERLAAITENGRIPVDKLSPEQTEALKKLQDYERAVATISIRLHEKIIEPVEERIRKELFSRKVE
jgi:antitoxin component of RelBE/YafQ-DinJ toxin-antitoxin module